MLVEAGFTPDGEQFAEASGQPENAVDTVHALVERPGLNLGDINQYVQMWLDMRVEKYGQVPETQYRAIVNVGLGLRFLVYDELTSMKKALLLRRLAEMRINDKVDGVVLTYEEGLMLREAAAAVNYTYDPGEPEDTPENIHKRTFDFTELEQRALHGNMPEPGRVVDSDQ